MRKLSPGASRPLRDAKKAHTETVGQGAPRQLDRGAVHPARQRSGGEHLRHRARASLHTSLWSRPARVVLCLYGSRSARSLPSSGGWSPPECRCCPRRLPARLRETRLGMPDLPVRMQDVGVMAEDLDAAGLESRGPSCARRSAAACAPCGRNTSRRCGRRQPREPAWPARASPAVAHRRAGRRASVQAGTDGRLRSPGPRHRAAAQPGPRLRHRAPGRQDGGHRADHGLAHRPGWRITVVDVAPLKARFLTTDPPAEATCEVDLLKEVLWRPPVVTDIGPVPNPDDLIGTKVRALGDRGLARDAVDVHAARHLHTLPELEALAARRPDEFDLGELHDRRESMEWISEPTTLDAFLDNSRVWPPSSARNGERHSMSSACAARRGGSGTPLPHELPGPSWSRCR